MAGTLEPTFHDTPGARQQPANQGRQALKGARATRVPRRGAATVRSNGRMLHVPSALPKISRRRALLSAAALALLGATSAGCGHPPPSPDLAELAAQLDRARADSKLAAEAAGALRPQSPQLRALTVVAAERTAHAQALSDELVRMAGTKAPTAQPSTTSSTPAPASG